MAIILTCHTVAIPRPQANSPDIFAQSKPADADNTGMHAGIVQNDQVATLEGRLERNRAELRDLATMGAVITSIPEINSVLSVVMDMAIRLANAEVGSIMLEEDNKLHVKISWGVGEELVRSLKHENGMDLPSYCLDNGKPVILSDLGLRDERGLSIESVICLPIQTSKRRHGVMILINKTNGGHFDERDKQSLEMLLNFVAVAIDNSILVEEKLAQQQVQQEMLIAKQIQETILPQNIDAIAGVELGVSYFPAQEVGGDFYDLIPISESSFVLIIGDVSNHGVPAALVMSAAAGIIKTTLHQNPDISVADLAAAVNNLLAREIIRDREMYITMFFSRFNLAEETLTFCNAGHLPGLFWDSQTRKICQLTDGGPIVGQFEGIKYKQGKHTLVSQDRLFLFTDGLTEAADADGNLLGRERAEAVLLNNIHLSPQEFCSSVKKRVDKFTVGAAKDTVDDFTILQVKVGGNA